jgi:hypothetical protein
MKDDPEGRSSNVGGMSEEDFQNVLLDAIPEWAKENDAPSTRVDTYAEVGMLTSNKGLVVRMGKAEFQVTIIRRR